MKKILFTLQDAPDHFMGLDVDIKPNENGEYTVREETALALLINKKFPQLYKSHRRMKQLIIIDEDKNIFKSEDFDIPGSIIKTE